MIKFEHTKVYNFMDAIRGMRNSYGSWDKIDSKFMIVQSFEDLAEYPSSVKEEFVFGPSDYELAMRLSKAGKAHDKFLRQILISVDIIGPLKWWDETDQYNFFVTNSTSAMHTLGKDAITADDFSFEDLDDDIKEDYLELINEARARWVISGKKKPSREWRQMIMLLASGYDYRRTFTSNYGQLKSMYHDRNRHRLSEWSHDFTKWVESLPYSELITLKDGD